MHPDIIPMTESDLGGVLAIEQNAFTVPWSRSAFLQELSHGDAVSLLIRQSSQGSEILAYICFRITVGEMHIMRIAVAAAHRKQGLARRLLGKALEIARANGADAAFLETGAGNLAAVRLYEGYGFSVVGRRKGYYPSKSPGAPREDALTLMRDLGEGESTSKPDESILNP